MSRTNRDFRESESVKKIASTTDPLWYKDAIIYELHVRAFADSNNDGIGDFPGLLSRLDYLKDLGITCIWLLPFFPSPLRDDGTTSPIMSTSILLWNTERLQGVPRCCSLPRHAGHDRAGGESHQRSASLVQSARQAPPGSPERDMYVWSETTEYKDARVIFTDTEKSNWTWDETAQGVLLASFFSHQPDLNYDNPLVMDEVLKAMRFWLDMGVDGLRIDAIPYLCERDGTSCENLPETHAIVKTYVRRLTQTTPTA